METRRRRQTTAALIKRGTWNEADARQLLDDQAASGETVTAFARRHGLVPQRLWWWKKRLGAQQPAASALPATFLPVVVRATEREVSAASIELGGGVRVELRMLDQASAAWVALVAQALGAAS